MYTGKIKNRIPFSSFVGEGLEDGPVEQLTKVIFPMLLTLSLDLVSSGISVLSGSTPSFRNSSSTG